MTTVSAIIVNWNGKDDTAACVQSLIAQQEPGLEIIVSDNGSTDGSIEHLKNNFPQVRLLQNGRNLGFGAAVNRGLAVANGNHLIFLNNDLILKPGSIRELVRFLEVHPEAGAAVPKILYCEKPDAINSFGVRIHYTGIACPHRLDEKDDAALAPQETACGGIFMLRREVYETVGGFDEDLFLYHEDHDLSWRLRLAGWKLMVNPDAVFYHHYRFNKGVRKFYYSEKNRLHLLLKHLEWKTLFLILPSLGMVETAQWAHSIGNGWFFLKLKSYLELTLLLPRILKKRRRIQANRKVSDAEITRLHEGALAVSGVRHPLLDHVLSPLLAVCWRWIRPRV